MAYVNIYDYRTPGIFMNLILGGRGCGKTYGALSGAYDEVPERGKFVYMRRTNEERELATMLNPFAQINANRKLQVVTDTIGKRITGFYEGEKDPEDPTKLKPVGAPLGYLSALSTMGTTRGLGLNVDELDKWIYDEFIPESHVRLLKNEGDAFFNAFETLNRNRELEGKRPLEVWLLANANNINNPIFASLGLIGPAEKTLRRGQKDYYDFNRGLALHFVSDADFVKAKKQTALARLTEGSDFYDMAFNNKFAYNDFTGIRRLEAAGMTPAYAVGDAHLWQRKGQKEFYASYRDGSFAYRYDPTNEADKILGRSRHAMTFKSLYSQGRITFESYEIKALLLDFFKIV